MIGHKSECLCLCVHWIVKPNMDSCSLYLCIYQIIAIEPLRTQFLLLVYKHWLLMTNSNPNFPYLFVHWTISINLKPVFMGKSNINVELQMWCMSLHVCTEITGTPHLLSYDEPIDMQAQWFWKDLVPTMQNLPNALGLWNKELKPTSME